MLPDDLGLIPTGDPGEFFLGKARTVRPSPSSTRAGGYWTATVFAARDAISRAVAVDSAARLTARGPPTVAFLQDPADPFHFFGETLARAGSVFRCVRGRVGSAFHLSYLSSRQRGRGPVRRPLPSQSRRWSRPSDTSYRCRGPLCRTPRTRQRCAPSTLGHLQQSPKCAPRRNAATASTSRAPNPSGGSTLMVHGCSSSTVQFSTTCGPGGHARQREGLLVRHGVGDHRPWCTWPLWPATNGVGVPARPAGSRLPLTSSVPEPVTQRVCGSWDAGAAHRAADHGRHRSPVHVAGGLGC